MDQSLSGIFNFADGGLEKMPGAIRNWGRLSDIMSAHGVITFE